MSDQARTTRFPSLSGSSLGLEKTQIPSNLKGHVNLLFVAFLMSQQSDIDLWLEKLGDVENTYKGLMVYEVPLMKRFPSFYRRWINNGMRAGIPDAETRSRTITVYTDRDTFVDDVGLNGIEDILTVLLDSDGEILWSHRGRFTPTALSALYSELEAAFV